VEKTRQDVSGVAEDELHVHVARLLNDGVHVFPARGRQIAPDLAELHVWVFFLELRVRGVEDSVAERDEHHVQALGRELVGQGLADACCWWWWCC
jgi:hypothetical protein